MSEFEVNLFGWLIVGLIIFNIVARDMFNWSYRRSLRRIAIERRLEGFTPNYDIVWRHPKYKQKEIIGVTSWDYALYARAGISSAIIFCGFGAAGY